MTNTAYRVWMYNPDGYASCEQFDTKPEADQYATGVRRRHPTWDVEVLTWAIPGSAR